MSARPKRLPSALLSESTQQELMENVVVFARDGSGIQLRQYQEQVALAVVESIIEEKGDSFVVVFPRQSGKNELQAHIEAYLLLWYSQVEAEMVKLSPTWKPQSLNAMRRLERVLKRNGLAWDRWVKESGYIYRVGSARIFFLSASPEAHIVGATASHLLEVDEAQDVTISKFDKDIAPMAASTNATRVFWGTAWTSRTLLARELRLARQAEEQDGRRRAFVLTAEQVMAEVPAYGRHVAEQVARLGRSHPMVRTQYYSEEIDGESGMFPERRLALMQGNHPRRAAPRPGYVYALLVDVAGEDEGKQNEDALFGTATSLVNPRRDSTALTVVEVELAGLADELVKAPVYRVVDRRDWAGVKHSRLYGVLKAQAEHWKARHLVIDATGVGAGLASFLEKALRGRVIPFIFSSATKSQLGWDFLSMIETGRFKDYAEMDKPRSTFNLQLSNCQMEIAAGPERKMKWGVPDGRRDAESGELVHDDWILSAALCAVLDEQAWGLAAPSLVVQAADPLDQIDREGFS